MKPDSPCQVDVSIRLYRLRMTAFWGPDGYAGFRKLILKWGVPPDTIHPEPPTQADGRASGSALWVKDPGDLETFVHELYHCIDDCSDSIGLEGSEARAYLFSHAFGLFETRFKKLKLWPEHVKP